MKQTNENRLLHSLSGCDDHLALNVDMFWATQNIDDIMFYATQNIDDIMF